MKKSMQVILASAAAVLFSVCAGCSMVRVVKPDIYDVKKLAIVSVYSNSELYNVEAGGRGEDISRLVAKTMDSTSLNLSRTRLVDHALEAFVSELGKVKGWAVIPTQAMIESAEYKAFAENFAAYQRKAADERPVFKVSWGGIKEDSGPFMTPQGMLTASMLDSSSSSGVLEQFGRLCSDLNVDAVAVIQLDMAYAPYKAASGASVLPGLSAVNTASGSGMATAAVAADVKVINRGGKFVAMTPDIIKGSGMRLRSDERTGMVFGQLMYNDTVEEMFLDAISKSAAFWAGEINKQL